MKDCESCGREFKSRTWTCPHCGFNNFGGSNNPRSIKSLDQEDEQEGFFPLSDFISMGEDWIGAPTTNKRLDEYYPPQPSPGPPPGPNQQGD